MTWPVVEWMPTAIPALRKASTVSRQAAMAMTVPAALPELAGGAAVSGSGAEA
jgi:hypothetical protein